MYIMYIHIYIESKETGSASDVLRGSLFFPNRGVLRRGSAQVCSLSQLFGRTERCETHREGMRQRQLLIHP